MIEFKNGITPLSEETFNKLQDDLLKTVFPIGSTYVTQTNTNPNEILGFGIWERLKGKVCLGLDENDTDMNTIGKTGGEKKHIQTIEEMPTHDHEQYAVANPDSGGNGTRGTYNNQSGTGLSIYETNTQTGKTGNGKAFNIMQPYEVVGYMWIRRS